MEESKRKKMYQFVKQHDKLGVFILIILMTVGLCLDVVIESGDEIWNYQNIYKMINGYKIYTDANVIITPFFYFIGFFILKVFGANLFIFRIYNICILTFCFMLIYIIFKKICNNKFIAFTYFSLIVAELISLCAGGANYNILAISFVLVGVYLNILWIEDKKEHNFIQATLIFIIFFTKQTIGVYYAIGIMAYQLLVYKNKKSIIKQIMLVIIETALLMCIFYKTEILFDFIDYALLGIREFSNKNIGGSLIDIIKTCTWFILIIVIAIVFIKSKNIDKMHKKYAYLLICLSIPMLLISYPIYNQYHGIIARIIVSILILYSVYIFAVRDFIENIKIKKMFSIIATTIIVLFSLNSLICFGGWIYNINNAKFSYTDCYFGGFFENEEKYNDWIEIIDYIQKQDKKVIILSNEAALYMMPLKLSNGAMDLPFYGNMGKDGEKKMIDKISKMYNVQVLIMDNGEELFWQESENINNYIKENYNYIGKIQDFAIFEK